MAQHGLENFHDEFLLLVILKYWKENKPETFKALNLDIRSIERMINKLHRPKQLSLIVLPLRFLHLNSYCFLKPKKNLVFPNK
jgi:hypothetical protein